MAELVQAEQLLEKSELEYHFPHVFYVFIATTKFNLQNIIKTNHYYQMVRHHFDFI